MTLDWHVAAGDGAVVNKRQKRRRRRRVSTITTWRTVLLLLLLIPASAAAVGSSASSESSWMTRRVLVVGGALLDSDESLSLRKQQHDLQQAAGVDLLLLNGNEQRQFVTTTCSRRVLELYEALEDDASLATLVFQLCAAQSASTAVALLSNDATWLVPLTDVVRSDSSLAMLGGEFIEHAMLPSLLVLQPAQRHVAQQLLQAMLEANVETLLSDPLWIPRQLLTLIAGGNPHANLKPGEHGAWYFLELDCPVNPFHKVNNTSSWHGADFCSVVDRSTGQALSQLSRDALLPQPSTEPPLPFNQQAGFYDVDNLPYISTIRQELFDKPDDLWTPSFFDLLLANDCLPHDKACFLCLSNMAGADCETCKEQCRCFCKVLCQEPVPPKFVAKRMIVTPPLAQRDPQRLVPRIIHQTWFEDLSQAEYPSMSRMVESFQQSGWEYRFYRDEDAVAYLDTHFPPEVRQAYEALTPGAFKADLFRYCVLLIDGGIYADVDILLEVNLDAAVTPDIGFLTPIDAPGEDIGKRMCVWNGLIAAAPAHPFLAKAIEMVVNQVRNRFTSLDVDASYCPDPETSILHGLDTLHTAGPCLLGAAMNELLGRHRQTQIEAGDLDIPEQVVNELGESVPLDIPGRAMILSQNKWDMGSHRFTLLEKNLLVAATDLPDSNDREKLQGGEKKAHYSKTHAQVGIYGLQNLYTDNHRANEDVRIVVGSRS